MSNVTCMEKENIIGHATYSSVYYKTEKEKNAAADLTFLNEEMEELRDWEVEMMQFHHYEEVEGSKAS